MKELTTLAAQSIAQLVKDLLSRNLDAVINTQSKVMAQLIIQFNCTKADALALVDAFLLQAGPFAGATNEDYNTYRTSLIARHGVK